MNYNRVIQAYLLIFSVILFGCNKSTLVEITPPPPIDSTIVNPPDSAKLIYINAASFSSPAHSLAAYDAFKIKKWEFLGNIPSDSRAIKTYIEGALYITGFDDVLQSISPSTATTNWSNYSFQGKLTYGYLISDQFLKDTVVAATSTLAPSNYNTLALIDKLTGNIFWSKIVTNQPIIPPVVSDGKIYCLTTNAIGTNMVLSSYDIVTKNLVWQKAISNSFLMSLPAPMILRGNTIILGSSTKSINVINKSNGDIIWSKVFNTDHAYLYGNEVVYNDLSFGTVVKVAVQTGETIMQSEYISFSRNGGVSYIYNNCFYNKVGDSVFCTNLSDGTLKWRKMVPPAIAYTTLMCIGNTVYASRPFISTTPPEEGRLMMLDAKDFSVKDSIVVPLASFNFSVLTVSGKFYR